jgi:hypothetical protein
MQAANSDFEGYKKQKTIFKTLLMGVTFKKTFRVRNTDYQHFHPSSIFLRSLYYTKLLVNIVIILTPIKSALISIIISAENVLKY